VFLQELLDAHAAGHGASAPQRALLLAALSSVADPDEPAGPRAPGPDLAAEPVGRITARLLRLRERLAGPLMEATVPCTACPATVEFTADTRDLLALEGKIIDAPSPLLFGDRRSPGVRSATPT
jgi:hypothetical protein